MTADGWLSPAVYLGSEVTVSSMLFHRGRRSYSVRQYFLLTAGCWPLCAPRAPIQTSTGKKAASSSLIWERWLELPSCLRGASRGWHFRPTRGLSGSSDLKKLQSGTSPRVNRFDNSAA